MPTYEPGSRPDNIIKSINNWIATNIATGLGLTIYYEGQGRIGSLLSTWVESFVIPGDYLNEPMLAHTGDRFATLAETYLNLNVFQLIDSGQTGLVGIYALKTTATNIMQLFGPLVVIPVYDYNTVGTPQDGGLQVDNAPIPKTVPTPPDMGVEQINLSVSMRMNSVLIS